MAGSTRESTFLPTIKCSMCAREISISMMGEHVCGGVSEPTPPLESDRNFEESMSFRKNPGGPGLFKSGRMPPRVDISVANRPYYRQDQLTPVSASSDSRSLSPRTPADGGRSPYGQPTVPLSTSLPSPHMLVGNIDDRFPPFPSSKSRKDKSSGRYRDLNEVDTTYAPHSPRIETGGLLKRMDSIAPGPFDIKSRQGPSRFQKERNAQMIQPDEPVFREHVQKPSLSSSIHSNSSNGSNSKAPPMPKMDRTGGYGGFDHSSSQEEERRPRLEVRAQTFPREEEKGVAPLHRSPSEPQNNLRSPSKGVDSRMLSNSVSPPRQRRPSTSGPDRSRVPPPRGASFYGARNGSDEIPPIPSNVNLAAEFGISNPYHTPSMSQSSNESGLSANGTTSSQSSPPSARSVPGRRPSGTSNFDNIMKDLQSTMIEDMSTRPPPASREQFAKPLPRPLAPSMLSPESPMDPAIQGGRLSPLPTRKPSPTETRRRPTTAKGDCKACSLPIKGKSVSSADGRLTGRYHKDCFVCTTCLEPFATSTFYVLNDAPYCERHYHKLNNSCCTACDRGIEGQYLETERKQKYHPTCLTCTDCRRTLRDDYFELNGRVYCERDAYRKAQQRNFLGPGITNKMERRTTRLLVM